MKLVDSNLPAKKRVVAYGLFGVVLVAVLILGFMSLGHSIGQLGTAVSNSEGKTDALTEGVKQTFQKPTGEITQYAEEERQ